MSIDVYGQALDEFHRTGRLSRPLLLHSGYGDIEEMPIDIFFREEDEFPELEFIALALCDGKTLDVGAGAGAHSLYLQSRGITVDALDISATACRIMGERGVERVIHEDFYQLKSGSYDTLLFLMNGIGIAQSIDGLKTLLNCARPLLSPRGQLIFDSSNISYLYDQYHIPRPDYYFGEIDFQYEYKGQKGTPFRWLYIDQQRLIDIAHQEGWVVQILYEDDNDQYLVRMEPRKTD